MGGPLNSGTIVESSYYLAELQLHNPTVKLPVPIMNQQKQSKY